MDKTLPLYMVGFMIAILGIGHSRTAIELYAFMFITLRVS